VETAAAAIAADEGRPTLIGRPAEPEDSQLVEEQAEAGAAGPHSASARAYREALGFETEVLSGEW
jgi:hypothetical protein